MLLEENPNQTEEDCPNEIKGSKYPQNQPTFLRLCIQERYVTFPEAKKNVMVHMKKNRYATVARKVSQSSNNEQLDK